MFVKENIKTSNSIYLSAKSQSARSNQILSAISAIDQRSTQSERVKNIHGYTLPRHSFIQRSESEKKVNTVEITSPFSTQPGWVKITPQIRGGKVLGGVWPDRRDDGRGGLAVRGLVGVHG